MRAWRKRSKVEDSMNPCEAMLIGDPIAFKKYIEACDIRDKANQQILYHSLREAGGTKVVNLKSKLKGMLK